MRNFLMLLVITTMLASALFAQDKEKAQPPAKVRFSVDMLDKSIDPCNDFYAYACSKWLAKNPIPADRSSWGRFNELQQRGEFIVRDILEKASVDAPGRSASQQKIGDYYASCMDESAIEKAGTKPLERDFPQHRGDAVQSGSRARTRSPAWSGRGCAIWLRFRIRFQKRQFRSLPR